MMTSLVTFGLLSLLVGGIAVFGGDVDVEDLPPMPDFHENYNSSTVMSITTESSGSDNTLEHNSTEVPTSEDPQIQTFLQENTSVTENSSDSSNITRNYSSEELSTISEKQIISTSSIILPISVVEIETTTSRNSTNDIEDNADESKFGSTTITTTDLYNSIVNILSVEEIVPKVNIKNQGNPIFSSTENVLSANQSTDGINTTRYSHYMSTHLRNPENPLIKRNNSTGTTITTGISGTTNATTTEISGTTTEISGTTSEISGTTIEISGTTSEISESTTEISESTTEISGITTEISGTTTEITRTTIETTRTTTEISGTTPKHNLADANEVIFPMSAFSSKTLTNITTENSEQELNFTTERLPLLTTESSNQTILNVTNAEELWDETQTVEISESSTEEVTEGFGKAFPPPKSMFTSLELNVTSGTTVMTDTSLMFTESNPVNQNFANYSDMFVDSETTVALINLSNFESESSTEITAHKQSESQPDITTEKEPKATTDLALSTNINSVNVSQIVDKIHENVTGNVRSSINQTNDTILQRYVTVDPNDQYVVQPSRKDSKTTPSETKVVVGCILGATFLTMTVVAAVFAVRYRRKTRKMYFPRVDHEKKSPTIESDV